jgi:iron(III) transport system ATP-binding protein
MNSAFPHDDGPVELAVTGVAKAFAGKPVLHDVHLSVRPGTVVALLGPSGCGKTTLLRTIAGLEVPDRGTVRIGSRTLTDGRAVTPPERRRIGMVFQDWALFPHLSVAANVGYGLPRGQRKGARVDEALELVGLTGLGERLPGTLSGGQQQRVALARALAPRPSVMLFDEPFSNLDTTLRVKVRGEVHRLLTGLGITSLFVTHDQEEAFVVGDEVAVMHGGRIVQQAAPGVMYDAPVDAWVARFVGDANLLPGMARDGWAATALGSVPLRDSELGGAVQVLIRPEELVAHPGGDSTVDRVESYGHDSMVFVGLPEGATVRIRVPGTTELRRHDRVTVGAADRRAVAFPVGPEPHPANGEDEAAEPVGVALLPTSR